MKVRYRKGVATHPGPESCDAGCEAVAEALTGEAAGQPLSREIGQSGVPTLLSKAEGNTADGAHREPSEDSTRSKMRHAHIWLDVNSLIGLVTSTDPSADALFDCAAHYVGCRNAELQSHMNVVEGFMRAVWGTTIPNWKKGRAIGVLLTNLIRFRSADWADILFVVDDRLGSLSGKRSANLAQAYLRSWAHGHILGLDFLDDCQFLKMPAHAARRAPRKTRQLRAQ